MLYNLCEKGFAFANFTPCSMQIYENHLQRFKRFSLLCRRAYLKEHPWYLQYKQLKISIHFFNESYEEQRIESILRHTFFCQKWQQNITQDSMSQKIIHNSVKTWYSDKIKSSWKLMISFCYFHKKNWAWI